MNYYSFTDLKGRKAALKRSPASDLIIIGIIIIIIIIFHMVADTVPLEH